MKAFEPQIGGIMMMIRQAMTASKVPPEQAQLMDALLVKGLKLAGEVDAVSVGVKFSETGATGTMVFQPLPNTSLARIAAALKPMESTALVTFDAPFVMALAGETPQAVNDEIAKWIDEIAAQVDAPAGEENKLKSLLESYKKMLAALSGRGAFVWNPSVGMAYYRVIEVVGVKPGRDLRAVTREYANQFTGLMTGMGMPFKMDLKYDEKVETWRGLDIDRMTVKFSLDPEKEADEQAKQMLKAMQAVYGDELIGFGAQLKDTLVISIGETTSAPIKAHLDRMLDGRKGNLLASPAWTQAVAALPKDRSIVTAVSVANLLVFVTKMNQVPGMGGGRLDDLKLDKPSAVGVSLSPVEKGFAMDFNVPMQEMLNVKQAIVAVTAATAPALRWAYEDPKEEGTLVVYDFENPGEIVNWQTKIAADVSFSNEHAASGKQSLKVVFKAGVFDWPQIDPIMPRDWSEYQWLKLDVFCEDRMNFMIRIDDEDSKNYATRYNLDTNWLEKGRNTVVLPLSAVAGKIDLSRVRFVSFFGQKIPNDYTFYIDRVRLVK
jgi:hypothetical protein